MIGASLYIKRHFAEFRIFFEAASWYNGENCGDDGISPLDFIRGIVEPSRTSIAVIPEGPYVIPRYENVPMPKGVR